MLRFERASVIACCLWSAVSGAAAETYELVKDYGVQGSIRRCKYSNGKVYALPSTAPSCYARIVKSQSPASKPTGDVVAQTDLPSTGVWWHANEFAKCVDGVSPAQAFRKLETDGLYPEVKKDGERIALYVAQPRPAQQIFYPTKKKCEEAVERDRPKLDQPQRKALTAQCTNKALAEGEQLRNTVKKWQVECDMTPNCSDCVPYYRALRLALEWDKLFPGCGTPLAGSKLMMNTVVRHLKALACRY